MIKNGGDDLKPGVLVCWRRSIARILVYFAFRNEAWQWCWARSGAKSGSIGEVYKSNVEIDLLVI